MPQPDKVGHVASKEAWIETRISPDLIPKTSFFRNLRSALKPGEWDDVRRAFYRKAGNKCQVCGGKGRLECHEVWEYDDSKSIQRLSALQVLCGLCHEVKHIGLAQVRGRYKIALAHMQRINGVDRKQAEAIVAEAFKVWKKRSAKHWNLDISALNSLILEARTF
jgi:hypothetical protein